MDYATHRKFAQGSLHGAPRMKPAVQKLGSKNILKPKGSHGGKMAMIRKAKSAT